MKKINKICSLSIYKLIRLITLDFLKDIKHIDKHVAFTTGNTIINKLTKTVSRKPTALVVGWIEKPLLILLYL